MKVFTNRGETVKVRETWLKRSIENESGLFAILLELFLILIYAINPKMKRTRAHAQCV